MDLVQNPGSPVRAFWPSRRQRPACSSGGKGARPLSLPMFLLSAERRK